MSDLLILSRSDVASVLKNAEASIVDLIRTAYLAYEPLNSHLPHSSFLRFPGAPQNRIIALPAFIGRPFDAAGIKWIASFPGNLAEGMERASAISILNDPSTGHPLMVCDAYQISAWRTAASAALATRHLMAPTSIERLGVIGCGPINGEVIRFLSATVGAPQEILCHDLLDERASAFARCQGEAGNCDARASSLEAVLSTCDVVSIATTANTPHLESLDRCKPNATILHLSVRDLSVAAILSAHNIVDDFEHVSREGTSIELTLRQVGGSSFVQGSLSQVLKGVIPARAVDERTPTVFTPFGLGILDVALCTLVYSRARASGIGHHIPEFFARDIAPDHKSGTSRSAAADG